MKLHFRALALWGVLGALSVLLVKRSPYAAIAALVLPGLAVWLTVLAAEALPERRWWRFGFWVVTVAGWLQVLAFVLGRAESHDREWQIIFFGFDLALLTAVTIAVARQSIPSRRVMGEVAIAAAFLALVFGVFAWLYEAGTRSIVARAEARWTEIGLPMAEFEKTLAPSRENAGSQVVREVLRKELNLLFYFAVGPAAERETPIPPSMAADQLVQLALGIISTDLPASDDFQLDPEIVSAFEPRVPALSADYDRILATEPARWASDPRDGYQISTPNFLGIRRLAQITAADSICRLSLGDQDGAARALAAGLHQRTGLLENPTMASLMVAMAVDAGLCPKQVRLPASEDGLPTIARDVVRLRAEYLRRLQMEAWVAMRVANRINSSDVDAEFPTAGGSLPKLAEKGIIPRWAARIVDGYWYRRHFATAVLHDAEQAAIQKSPARLVLPDLGVSPHETVAKVRPTIAAMSGLPAIMRIHATLLLREQVELIRDARARLASGRPVESRDSVVLPGVRWELIADAEKATVATRLAGAPEWIVNNAATGPGFWVLPIDGSVAWQFRLPAPTARRD